MIFKAILNKIQTNNSRPPNYQRYLYSKFFYTGKNYTEKLYREFQTDDAHQRRVYGRFKIRTNQNIGSQNVFSKKALSVSEDADLKRELLAQKTRFFENTQSLSQNNRKKPSKPSQTLSHSSKLSKKALLTLNKALILGYSFIQTLLETVCVLYLVMALVFFVSVVQGASMNPTLKNQDKVVIGSLLYTPRVGDIVALFAKNLPNTETGKTGELIVKRIIGLEGDVIDIDPESGIVYRNSKPLNEPYISENINAAHMGNAKFPLTVDKGCVFVLGDNRNRSTDSRYVDDGETEYYVGCIDVRYIVGKVIFRLSPLDRIGVIL